MGEVQKHSHFNESYIFKVPLPGLNWAHLHVLIADLQKNSRASRAKTLLENLNCPILAMLEFQR